MDVILLERIERLGNLGDVVSVKPGYARNYLLPQGKAQRASKENIEHFEKQRSTFETDNAKRREEAGKSAEAITDLMVVVIRQAGESGQLYGSVSPRDIAAEVSKKGTAIDRRQVSLDQPIKELGLHSARIALHPEVSVVITVNVALNEEDAKVRVSRAAEAASEAETAKQAEAAGPAKSKKSKDQAEPEAEADDAEPAKGKKAKDEADPEAEADDDKPAKGKKAKDEAEPADTADPADPADKAE